MSAFDPFDLPIYNHEEEIVAAIRDHQVIVVEGSTGCGKTTQLPRIILRAGLVNKAIGITQPRRIAAVSVASRIAQEMDVPLGEEVGYAIRFDDKTSPETRVKVMTDGILLQEARTDHHFENYGIIMVDEAHERTLNIDFTLGLLHRAVGASDLKVIVSSATLKPEEFQEFFADVAGEVPLISIESRPFPVRHIYRPVVSDDTYEICETAADEVMRIHRRGKPGHILVFMPGEAAINRTIENIAARRPGTDMVLLPLFGRLTREEQEEVFVPYEGKRKVVVATNIAETSITIPGTVYVIDSGLAKVPRVQTHSGITVLKEEGISQASSNQRAGRAGRTAPGEAIRLYSKREYHARPEHTTEEILRLDLTEVVLRLIALGIQDVEDFPFPTPPRRKYVRAALTNLETMRAIDRDRMLTEIGQRMVPFPLSPALSRMIVEAMTRYPDVVEEVLVVGAFLSARSPYLFPSGEEEEARAAQLAMAHPGGDALTAIETYHSYLGSRNTADFCERNYLDPHIMAFIEKAHGQLRDIASFQGIDIQSGGKPEGIIRSLMAGFANAILMSERRLYAGRSIHGIAIHPSSAAFRERFRFIVSAEIFVAKRAYAKHVSPVDPEWISEDYPELAKLFRIKKRKKDKKFKLAEAKIPKTIRIGTVSRPVAKRRGRPSVALPLEDITALIKAGPDALEPAYHKFQATIMVGDLFLGTGVDLKPLLALLPWIPLPEPDQRLRREHAEGTLLDAERNLHALERDLDRILAPALPSKGKRPGWIMLVANGGGGYWYEVCPRFPDALETSMLSLEDLRDRLESGDPLLEHVERLLQSWDETRDAVTAIIR